MIIGDVILGYLPKSKASCFFANGRAVYGKRSIRTIAIDKYIIINDSFKNGNIKIETSCGFGWMKSCETYLNYKKIDDKLELSINE